MIRALRTALAAALLLSATSAPAMVIDFDGFSAGQIIDDELIAFGITVTAFGVGNAPNTAVIFDSNAPTGGDSDLAAPFAPGPDNPYGDLSPGNLLILHETDNCDASNCPDPDDQGARPAGTIRSRARRADRWRSDAR